MHLHIQMSPHQLPSQYWIHCWDIALIRQNLYVFSVDGGVLFVPQSIQGESPPKKAPKRAGCSLQDIFMRFLKCTTFLDEDGEWWLNSISPYFTKIQQKSLWSDPSKSPSTGIEVQRVSWKFIRIPRLTSANQLHPKFPWFSTTASAKILGEMTVFAIQLSNSISIGAIQETKSADFKLNIWHDTFLQLIWMILRFHEHSVPSGAIFWWWGHSAPQQETCRKVPGASNMVLLQKRIAGGGGAETYGKDTK